MRTTKGFLGSPGLSRFASENGPRIVLRGNDFETIVDSGSIFKNDVPGSPLKSTQQIPLDWSKFENHTFFGSSQVNVNVAFDTIINGFPFDGKKEEIDVFFSNLTGFEKWVYDQFPKNVSSLHFKNSYISIDDVSGIYSKEMSRKNDGKPSLDPGDGNISFQFKAFFPQEINDNQVICQRLSNASGYTIALSSSNSTSEVELYFIATSGSSALSASMYIEKGRWNDIGATLNRKPNYNKLFLYIDGDVASTSSNSFEFYEFNANGTKLIIGSGSSHDLSYSKFIPAETLSGSLDDFRVYHGNRTPDMFKASISSSQYPEEDLRLYYKFNEPSGSYSQNSIVIDSSANGLHSTVQGYTQFLRSNPDGIGAFDERIYENPVLFPDVQQLITLNQSLLASASYYDSINPNMITKLIPPHYFFEGMLELGLQTEEGTVINSYPETGDLPKNSKLGSSQIMSFLMFIWAKQFDEIKIFLDHFSKIESYEYDRMGSIADSFLIQQAKNIGIELPQLFSTLKPSDEDDGINFGTDPGAKGLTLQEIQSYIWRRIIASSSSMFKSKGTISSIKEIISAFGINPDTSVRLREYGGAREGVINSRKKRRVSAGKLATNNSQYVIISPFLSGSRIEPGIPLLSGTMTSLGSDSKSDGLLTSGSWLYEATYKFPETSQWDTQSLVRFYATGSSGESLLFNLVANRNNNNESNSVSLKLHSSVDSAVTNQFSILIDSCSLFDGDRWHVSFGRNKISNFESMFALRVGKQLNGSLSSTSESITYVTFSLPQNDVLSNVDDNVNASGSYFRVGNYDSHDYNGFIDVTTNQEAAVGNFSGEISSVKFYSKFMEGSEWYEHILNHESLGVKDPHTNFGFSNNESGSFEKIRIDATFDQQQTGSDSLGNILIFDYSQNNLHLSGSGFSTGSLIITFDDIIFSSLDPKFDERSSDNKIRVRSWNDYNLAKSTGEQIAPIYEVPKFEEGVDDNRFGVEISIVQSLNEDMIKMFSDFSYIDFAVGDPTNMFNDSYMELEDLQEIYFNRLTGIPEYSNVILFSKWFESSISKLIEQFLPFNTRFMGVNLVVESHMLERAKMSYRWGDLYLGENNRRGLRGTIGLAQLVANIRRF